VDVNGGGRDRTFQLQGDYSTTLRKEIFAEEIFADFDPIREIKSRSEKKESKWAINGVKMDKRKLLIREIKFRENFFP